MSDSVNKAGEHRTKAETQQRDAAFWARTLETGRQQRQAGAQMSEAERETQTEKPRQQRQ